MSMLSGQRIRQVTMLAVCLVVGASMVLGADDWFAGQWKGTWEQGGGESGTFQMTVEKKSDGTVGGTLQVSENDAELYSATFKEVSVTGKKISVKLDAPDGQAEMLIEGELLEASLEGTYSYRPAGAQDFTPAGKWKGAKQ
jgi:hypothetical protein